MRGLLISFLGASAAAMALHPSCGDVTIPIHVSTPRFIINTAIRDNWDAAALTFNLTRRDSGQPADPLPLAGQTSVSIQSTFEVGATLCGKQGQPILILTHGIIESKKYWQPDFQGSERYNFVSAALAAGYSVLNYDRIGVGFSARGVDPYHDAQFQVETAVLDSLISYARQTLEPAKVALVGHSYGAYISATSANHTAVDALVLTGFSGFFDNFAPFVAGAGFRVASLQNPKRWGNLDPAYLMMSDLYAEVLAYFAEGWFDKKVAEWSHSEASEPFAVGELPSLLASYDNFNNVTAPVLVLQGQFDQSACGGNCAGQLGKTKEVFQGATVFETVDDLPAGHNLNFHKVAPQAFQILFQFLKKHGV